MSKTKKVTKACSNCASSDVSPRMRFKWNYDKQDWEMIIDDFGYCGNCDDYVFITEISGPSAFF